MNNSKLRGYVRPDTTGTQIETWGWPEMEVESEIETNALGLPQDWYSQSELPPEPEPAEEPAPSITAEELEAIRQAAWEEGMAEGQAAGFAKGLEEGKLEGLKQGHDAGLSQGKEEGLALGRELVEQEQGHWRLLASRLADPLAEQDAEVEQQLIALVMQLTRALIKQEAVTSPALLLGALKEGLALLPASNQGVTLSLHPDDIARVVAAFGEEECERRHWRLESDPTLLPGDIQLATEFSSVDLTLSGRIDQLLRNFLRGNQRD